MSLTSLISSAVSAAASFFGGERRNEAQAEQAAAANAFSAQQFATRYQTTVKDMEAAGLSPMLAYGQGGGSPPVGQQAQMQDTASPAVSAGLTSSLQTAQKEVLQAQAEQARAAAEASSAQAAKTRAETPFVDPLAQADIDLKTSSAGASRASIGQINAAADKLRAELPNVVLEGQRIMEDTRRLKALYLNLAESSALMAQQGLTEVSRRQNLAAATRKLVAEGKIAEADYKAMEDTNFFGRVAREVKPISDVAGDWLPQPGKILDKVIGNKKATK